MTKSAGVYLGLVSPVNLVLVKVKIRLLGAVQGKSPQSFTFAQAVGGLLRKAQPESSTSVKVLSEK